MFSLLLRIDGVTVSTRLPSPGLAIPRSMTESRKSLQALRREIDAIDDRIHDLLMERTEVVESVRNLKRNERVKIRPAREAEIIYRLIGRHHGPFPKRELVRIWREIIVATLSFEGPFSVAIYSTGDSCGLRDLARDQYGSFVPMTTCASPRQLIDMVDRQEATVGVLPLPAKNEADPWWRHLATGNPNAPKVIARLPFVGAESGRSETPEALVICPVGQEQTGRDRSLFIAESKERVGLDRLKAALAEAGLVYAFGTQWHDAQARSPWLSLLELDGFVPLDDPGIVRFSGSFGEPVSRLLSLGGYALPLGPEDLKP